MCINNTYGVCVWNTNSSVLDQFHQFYQMFEGLFQEYLPQTLCIYIYMTSWSRVEVCADVCVHLYDQYPWGRNLCWCLFASVIWKYVLMFVCIPEVEVCADVCMYLWCGRLCWCLCVSVIWKSVLMFVCICMTSIPEEEICADVCLHLWYGSMCWCLCVSLR